MRASLGVVLFIAGLSLLVELYALPRSVSDVVATSTLGALLSVSGLGALVTSVLVTLQPQPATRGDATVD